jgi:hypothetical protein
MNCERYALDERCTKHPDTMSFKRCCSQECYQHAKLNGTLKSPNKLTVWPVIPGHAPLPKVKMKVVGSGSFSELPGSSSTTIDQQREETAVLCMYMVQNTATPPPTVRLCAIGQVQPGLRWLCTLPCTRRPQRSTDNKYKTIYELVKMNVSDTEFDADDTDVAMHGKGVVLT